MKTLCVCLALPGLSDNNILPVFEVINSPDDFYSEFDKNFDFVYSWEDPNTKWKLVRSELHKTNNSEFDGIIIGFYNLVT